MSKKDLTSGVLAALIYPNVWVQERQIMPKSSRNRVRATLHRLVASGSVEKRGDQYRLKL